MSIPLQDQIDLMRVQIAKLARKSQWESLSEELSALKEITDGLLDAFQDRLDVLEAEIKSLKTLTVTMAAQQLAGPSDSSEE